MQNSSLSVVRRSVEKNHIRHWPPIIFNTIKKRCSLFAFLAKSVLSVMLIHTWSRWLYSLPINRSWLRFSTTSSNILKQSIQLHHHIDRIYTSIMRTFNILMALSLLHSTVGFSSLQSRAVTCRPLSAKPNYFASSRHRGNSRLMMSDGAAAAEPKKGFVEKVNSLNHWALSFWVLSNLFEHISCPLLCLRHAGAAYLSLKIPRDESEREIRCSVLRTRYTFLLETMWRSKYVTSR